MRNSNHAFTLVELLVVIAILGLLAAIVLPALAYTKFRSRVTICSNNYRQLTLSAAMYAGDDSQSRLPSFELPTESSQLTNFRDMYPWIVGLPMFKAMEMHGASQPKIWFCPLRQRWQDASATFQWQFKTPLATIDDLTKYFTETQNAKYGFVDANWWVPRTLEGSTLAYPDVSLLLTRVKTPWPSRLNDPSISTRPLISDWLHGGKNISGDGLGTASGGHSFGRKIQSCNSGFADGHVQTTPAAKIKWELQLSAMGDYIFY